MPTMTGLSGNEIWCLAKQGFRPGELVIGNSVFSMGVMSSLGALGGNLMGGEVTQITGLIRDGRLNAYQRLVREAERAGGVAVTGVSNELKRFQGNTEFLSVGSALHTGEATQEKLAFTTASDGMELYCQIDAGFAPKQFVFGNIAYSVGAIGGLIGGLQTLARGEIKEFSDIFNRTRHTALLRIKTEAFRVGANAVVGIKTYTMRYSGAHEMLMIGTASNHPLLPKPKYPRDVVTSDMTCEEMWNMANLGYMPTSLLLGSSVYSLGVVGGIKALFKSVVRGEISDLTSLIYDARAHAIGLIRTEASNLRADQVVGIKTHIHTHGSLLEFMAVGTALRRLPGLTTAHPNLPPQALMRDKTTWFDNEFMIAGESD